MHNYLQVAKLFSSSALPIVVSDSDHLISAFVAHGFSCKHLPEIYGCKDLPESLILALTDPSMTNTVQEYQNNLANTAILVFPFVSFSGNHEQSINYFLSRLKEIDFELACIRSQNRLEQLQGIDGSLNICTMGNQLFVELGRDIEIFAPMTTPNIKKGEWISVGQFLEVALIPNKNYSCYSLNGEFACDGISIAFHAQNYSLSRPLALEAWSLFENVRKAGGFPLRLTVVNSEVTRITTAYGDNIIDKVRPLTDQELNGKVTEVGFASLDQNPATDWTINSILNESAGGVHLALGTGVKAAHIDFISSSATLL